MVSLRCSSIRSFPGSTSTPACWSRRKTQPPRCSLLERVRFVAIFESNLDEFFMKRVGGLKQQVASNLRQLTPYGRTPRQQLAEIQDRVRPLLKRQRHLLANELRPDLSQHGLEIGVISYPQCTFSACSVTAAVPRSVVPTYTDGYLTALDEYAPSITYHPNGQVAQIEHGSGFRTVITNDPNGMRRPRSFEAQSPNGTPLWTTGNYVYDGTGNVTKIGGQWFTYDKVSRLSAAKQDLGAKGGGTSVTQNYSYDAFGNLQSILGTSGRNTPTSSSTNRLTSPGTAYDAAGNMTSWSGASYEYDALDRMWHMQNGGENWLYLYTPDDERLWSFKIGGDFSAWSLRDLDQKVLRDYTSSSLGWTVERDYLYRGSQLLGAIAPKAPRYYHLDHLGTPRLVTSSIRSALGYHVYFPYGEEATNPNQGDQDRIKFTGHERDLGSAAGTGDDLDYMHARFCSPVTGRFLSVDRHPAKAKAPQSWNRYLYARGNPTKFVDPNGLAELLFTVTTFIPAASVTDPLGRVFGGDGRGFNASSPKFRTRQSVKIETDQAKRANPLVSSRPGEIGPTHRLDQPAVASASSAGLMASGSRDSQGNAVVQINGSASNPLATPSASIDYSLKIIASPSGNDVSLTGTQDGFPAMEIYVTNSQGRTVAVYQFDPDTVNNSPMSLFPVVGDQSVNVLCSGLGSSGGSCTSAPQ